MDAESALEKINDKIETLDTAIAELEHNDPHGAMDRLTSLHEKLKSIAGTVNSRGTVSSAQRGAINSYCATVDQVLETIAEGGDEAEIEIDEDDDGSDIEYE